MLKYLGSLITRLPVTKGYSYSVLSIASYICLCFCEYFLIPQTWDKSLSAINYFDSLSSVEQMCKTGIFCVPVISVLTGLICKFRALSIILHLAICLGRQAVLLSKNNCWWVHVWASSTHNPYKVIFQTPW